MASEVIRGQHLIRQMKPLIDRLGARDAINTLTK